jgi:hypothetical protein
MRQRHPPAVGGASVASDVVDARPTHVTCVAAFDTVAARRETLRIRAGWHRVRRLRSLSSPQRSCPSLSLSTQKAVAEVGRRSNWGCPASRVLLQSAGRDRCVAESAVRELRLFLAQWERGHRQTRVRVSLHKGRLATVSPSSLLTSPVSSSLDSPPTSIMKTLTFVVAALVTEIALAAPVAQPVPTGLLRKHDVCPALWNTELTRAYQSSPPQGRLRRGCTPTAAGAESWPQHRVPDRPLPRSSFPDPPPGVLARLISTIV